MAKNNVTDWDTTAGNNTDVGGVSIAEGWPPENVNNAARETMAQLAALHGDITGKLTSAGTGTAYTLTTNDGIATPAAGAMYKFIAHTANTGAATLAVNGGVAKSILKNHDVALVGGEIEANQIVEVAYEATNDAYLMLSQPAKTLLESLDVDNININGNTISSTDTNGDITLSPDGTGNVVASKGINITGDSSISGNLSMSAATPTITFTETGNNADCRFLIDSQGAINIAADFNNEVVGTDIALSVDGTKQVLVTDGTLQPETDNDIDLGAAAAEFKDLFIDGTANIDALTLTSGATCTAILDEDDMASDSATALATQQSIKAYADNKPSIQTAQATTSGASKNFTGIPASATRIHVMLSQVSLTANGHINIQLGTSGGLVTTGYLSTGGIHDNANGNSAANSTQGFLVYLGLSTRAISGIITIMNVDGTEWVASFSGGNGGTLVHSGGGYVDAGGDVTQVSVLGTNLDDGKVNVAWD